jgi:lipopolysaccharide transport system permease protein
VLLQLNYFLEIWRARHFWYHLSLSDLRAKWRRSYFGILWSIIQPLGLTIMLSVVFGKIFKLDIAEYAVYVLSGIIVWEFVVGTANGGSLSFVQADAYIKQQQRPLAIYPLRSMLTQMIGLMVASLSLFGWVIIANPTSLSWTWLATLSIYPILALIGWPMATFLAHIGVRFRDFPHALGLIFQAIWFVSPIYFHESIFRNGGLDALVDYNPVYHLLEIVRAPLIRGALPTAENFAFCFGLILVLTLLAWVVSARGENKVIFYL